jgi:hypothetical protein
MTPGFAKSRHELPWLYYPETDSVIINAHNFGGGGIWTPAVSGKMPVAAWVPSRDDAGNGTTTLTDLVGSNNGTLTNMDAATDWVADTDAGGVRALEFDGVNDHILTTLTAVNAAANTISFWVKSVGAAGTFYLSQRGAGGNQWQIWHSSSDLVSYWNGSTIITGSSLVSGGNWVHVCVVRDGTSIKWYRNGILTHTKTSSVPTASTQAVRLMTDDGTTFGAGTIDDIRIFDQALNATDVADLYAAGRGGQA